MTPFVILKSKSGSKVEASTIVEEPGTFFSTGIWLILGPPRKFSIGFGIILSIPGLTWSFPLGRFGHSSLGGIV